MIQLVLAVEQLQIGEILLENVNVRLQEGLSKSLKQIFTTQTFLLVALNKKQKTLGQKILYIMYLRADFRVMITTVKTLTCIAAVNWASFSIVSSAAPF